VACSNRRHTGNPLAKLEACREFIVEANRATERTAEQWRALVNVNVTERMVRTFAREVFDDEYVRAQALIRKFQARLETEGEANIREETKAAIAKLEELMAKESRIEKKILAAMRDAPGGAERGDTAWGMLNAATYVIDHDRGKADNRLDSSWFGTGANRREKASKLALALAD
jgi:hypothetical protein